MKKLLIKLLFECQKKLIRLRYGKPIKGEPMTKERVNYPPAMPFDNISYFQWRTYEWRNHFNKTMKEIHNNNNSNTLI